MFVTYVISFNTLFRKNRAWLYVNNAIYTNAPCLLHLFNSCEVFISHLSVSNRKRFFFSYSNWRVTDFKCNLSLTLSLKHTHTQTHTHTCWFQTQKNTGRSNMGQKKICEQSGSIAYLYKNELDVHTFTFTHIHAHTHTHTHTHTPTHTHTHTHTNTLKK